MVSMKVGSSRVSVAGSAAAGVRVHAQEQPLLLQVDGRLRRHPAFNDRAEQVVETAAEVLSHAAVSHGREPLTPELVLSVQV